MQQQIMGTCLALRQGDITKAEVDVIVNAANEALIGGGGVDGAIRRAGGDAIEEACAEIRARQGGCPTGEAVITTGGNLAARYVIHTVGPVWKDGNSGEPALLASCYRESMRLTCSLKDKDIRTVAFSSISTGIYGYPLERAAAVALKTVKEFVGNNVGAASVLTCIQFVLFDEVSYNCYADVFLKV